MTASAVTRGRTRRNEKLMVLEDYTTAEAIQQGDAVSIDHTSGLAYMGTDSATRTFVGIAQADAASGATVKVAYGHDELFTCTTNVVYAITNKNVTLLDDNTVDIATGGTTNDQAVGALSQMVTSTSCWVRIRVFGSAAS